METLKFVFISPVTWRFYKLQNQVLASELAQRGYNVAYIEPVKYKNADRVSRLHTYSTHAQPELLSVIERRSILKRGMLLFLYENLHNAILIGRIKPDVVVCYDHLMGLISCLYCKIKGIKFIFNVSDDWDYVPQQKGALFLWKKIIKPFVLRYAGAILSVSHKQYNLCLKKYKHTFLLPNGIEMSFLKKIDKEGCKKESGNVNFIAHLRDWYDFDLLIDIFVEMPQISLYIYGDGPLKDELLQKTAHIPNIHVCGNRTHEDTARLLGETSIGLIPLKKTILNDSTCPVKLFDYWAARKAVVATPTEELKIIGTDCVLFASTKDEWVKQIQFLLENPARRQVLGNTGREKIDITYNYDAITASFLKITEGLLKTE